MIANGDTEQDLNADAAREVMRTHFDALNRRDGPALAGTLHFPHYRLTDGILKIWETPDNYLSDFRKRAGRNWGHSELGDVVVVHSRPEKVHLDVTVLRFDGAGELLVSFQSLWVIAKINGVWAAQLRSSFTPDAQISAQAAGN